MNIHVELHLPDGRTHRRTYHQPISGEQIAAQFQAELPYQILACRIDHVAARLNCQIDHDCRLELLDLRDPSANMSYQVSLSFLYIRAVHEILGKDVAVTIANSLNKGLYTVIRTSGVTEQTAGKIEQRMRRYQEQNLPFAERTVGRPEMLHLAAEGELQPQRHLIESAPDLTEAQLCRFQGESQLFYHPLVPSTGYLKWFDVRRYKNGMLLRFPHPTQPDVMPAYEDQKLLYEAFSEATRWDKITAINFASDLNDIIGSSEFSNLVLLSEALHERRIAEIAATICQSHRRIILIAGPSSSGKTSFAKRLCIQMRVSGMRPLYLGTDDYFKDRQDTPLDANGKKDYESLKAVDTDLFTRNMNDLLSGRKTDLPTFDFVKGEKIFGQRIQTLEPAQPIVIEGIHGLNPQLTAGIADDQKLKIYISPLTQLNIDDHNRIPTTDARMLRRLVRDYQFRGHDARETIQNWPAVRAGEEQNIFPYSREADIFFNSHCQYEIAVLKYYAQPLLEQIKPAEPEYPEAQRILKFLEFFVANRDNAIIPNNSILREFIGGSVLVQ